MAAFISCGQQSLPRETAPAELTAKIDRCFPEIWGCGVDELHCLMVLQHGKVIYERYDAGHSADELHVLWSATKTFNATAIGFAQQDGLLSVEDPIVKFFSADELPANPDERLSRVKIKHLLMMASGFEVTPINTRVRLEEEFNPVVEGLASPFVSEPGTQFRYNSLDSYLLSVIVTKVTGMTSEDYLEQKLFKPLGIKEWHYDKCPLGYSCGGWGLFLTTESLAKMGQFFLQRGVWNGKRLLDEAWFDEATKAQIYQAGEYVPDSDGNAGYGYQMWCCKRPGAVRLDGAWGQYCIICPEKDAVIVAFAHCGNTKNEINALWRNIYDNL